ncbi:hypothetical protein [Moraxella pluranimalium]|uniref:Uncharacterized protein n=1 Tax=Moraxella pluranimalium TaxID=470453 RepID=A0A1T0CM18_9GAMM|nr:hypothetical protein [Moraxella pluranimalium]OOS23402.1 hypothetical protein B0680_07470 [Moraxella pluranimalium]
MLSPKSLQKQRSAFQKFGQNTINSLSMALHKAWCGKGLHAVTAFYYAIILPIKSEQLFTVFWMNFVRLLAKKFASTDGKKDIGA